MQGVEAMRSEIGRHAASVVPEPTITTEKTALIEGSGGRGSDIKVPSETWRGVRARHSTNSFRRHVQVIPDSDEMHRSQVSALNDSRHFAIMRGRTVLGAGLNDSVGATRRLDYRAPLLDCMPERFLHIHILACPAGQYRGYGVPVVRRRDDHSIHVLLLEQLSEVTIRPAGRARPGFGRLSLRVVNVTDRGEVHVRKLPQEVRQQTPSPATANQRDIHPVVRAKNPSG